MREVALYIAMSVDGYIADKNGKVDFLKGQNDTEQNGDSYDNFIKEVDTVVMGWNTYYQIVTELSPNEWVYNDMMSYVITHRTLNSTDNIVFTQTAPCDLVKQLKQQKGEKIWICGGSNIIQPLIQNELIDEYIISIVPTILGSGIRLFGQLQCEIKLKLVQTQYHNGITELVYKKRECNN
ncbi:dihydrofolate reductase family protein [Clostridium sp. MD294]|uniref:dihydrofolate reductase family protein n=1 Tax=Clostridium sp. MD294 TaxID=97138 RepID=UPI0002CC2C29|nr:dihydrofolate reductase family protein [Clostridium sp. MD294]NDO47652.1 dihydrofolate reductase [Clostridium sp. MD294]USF30031.1 putative protein YyaP [Clostridium sp. MD294]